MLKKRIIKLFAIVVSALVFLFSIQAAAQSAQGSAGSNAVEGGISVVTSVAMGKMLQKPCYAQTPDRVSCALMTVSYAQAALSAANMLSSKGAKKGFSSTPGDFAPGFGDPNGPPDDDGPSGGGPGGPGSNDPGGDVRVRTAVTDARNGLARAKANGYTVNEKDGTITTPKGKFPLSAMNSAKSMLDSGLISKDEYADADKLLKNIQDKFKVTSMGVAGGGGGGGSSSGAGKVKFEYFDDYKSGFSERANAPRTSGLTRALASGESIGAQTDNIFEMIRRRYQQKTEEKIFVGQEPSAQ